MTDTADEIVIRINRWHAFALGVAVGALAYAIVSMLLAPAPPEGGVVI